MTIAHLILVTEALGIHSKRARVILYALPSRLGPMFFNEELGCTAHDEYGLLKSVLPLALMPERYDAVLLHAVLRVSLTPPALPCSPDLMRLLSLILRAWLILHAKPLECPSTSVWPAMTSHRCSIPLGIAAAWLDSLQQRGQ